MNEQLKSKWDREKELIDCMALYIDHVITIAACRFGFSTDSVFNGNDVTNIIDCEKRYQFILTMPLGIEMNIWLKDDIGEERCVYSFKNKFGNIEINNHWSGQTDEMWFSLEWFIKDIEDYTNHWKRIFDYGPTKTTE